MSIEALKEKARKHEQKEQWQKALDLYNQAIDRMGDENADIGLYNRAGDLNTRINRLDDAVTCYNKAIDLYMEAELPNNAIAVCKKIIRNVPQDAGSYLRMGQIRAAQGFMVDARANYISYAERVDQDEALRALEEFADTASDDHEIRMLLSAQMEQVGRNEDAAQQLLLAVQVMNSKGMGDEAAALNAKIQELDPDAQLAAAGAAADDTEASAGMEDSFEDAFSMPSFDDDSSDFGGFEIGGDEDAAEESEEAAPEPAAEMPEDGDGDADEGEVDFGGFEIGGDDEEAEAEEEAEELPMMSFDDEPADDSAEEASDDEPLPTFSMDEDDEGGDEPEDDHEPLPMMSFDDEDDEGDADPLPLLSDEPETGDGEDSPEDEEAAEELPTFSMEGDEAEAEAEAPVDDAVEEVSEAVEAAMEDESSAVEEPVEDEAVDHQALADSGDHRGAIEALDAEIATDPDSVELRQRRVEYAFRVNDPAVMSASYFGLADALERSGQEVRAKAVYQQALQADSGNAEAQAALDRLEGGTGEAAAPAAASGVASSDDYVDLGSMILSGGEDEKSTRFVVAYEEPSGDEQADFKKMLAQFKEKVSENIDADDVTAHYDLGTAYREMGLLDEAIQEYQQALRASADHLPTYEMLGQTFLDQGQFDAAVRSLTRALDAEYEIEDELMGIYYYLGRAHEELGNQDEAVEFYDRVFSLDINFADVTERLRALRP